MGPSLEDLAGHLTAQLFNQLVIVHCIRHEVVFWDVCSVEFVELHLPDGCAPLIEPARLDHALHYMCFFDSFKDLVACHHVIWRQPVG